MPFSGCFLFPIFCALLSLFFLFCFRGRPFVSTHLHGTFKNTRGLFQNKKFEEFLWSSRLKHAPGGNNVRNETYDCKYSTNTKNSNFPFYLVSLINRYFLLYHFIYFLLKKIFLLAIFTLTFSIPVNRFRLKILPNYQ